MSEATHGGKDRRWRLQSWLGIQSDVKPKVYAQVFETTEMNSVSYWLEIFFSAGIATFGLVESSPAVIIGAMLISPLMGPIMATGMSLAVGDLYLGIRAVLNLVASVTVSITFAGFLVWLLPFHSATPEILSRTNPNLLDLAIALFSGLAGSVVVCRGSGDGVTALPGVAIAVALMPPLCVMGFGLGSGLNFDIMGGAGLLFLTNLVAIVASAFVVFLLVGMSTPEVDDAMLALRGNERLARILSRGAISRILPAGGQLRWRLLMVLILLGSIAVPLRRALLQVARETLTRAAVNEELGKLSSENGVVSQQVSVSSDVIAIRLISTHPIPGSKIAEVRQDLMRRTGRDVQIADEAVASQSAVAALMERLDRPAPAVPKEQAVAEIQQELLDKVRPALRQIWPSAAAPMQGFNVAVGTSGFVVEVQYQAAEDLGAVPLDMIARSLRTSLAMPDLTLRADRIVPPPAPATPPGKARKGR